MSKDQSSVQGINVLNEGSRRSKRLSIGIMGLNVLSVEEIRDLLGEEAEYLLDTEIEN